MSENDLLKAVAAGAVKEELITFLTVRLDTELRRVDQLHEVNASLQQRLAEMQSYLERVEQWRHITQTHIDTVRQSASWKLMRALRRFGALVVRGEDEGRRGFLKWGVSRITKKGYPLSRSYDPLADTFDLTPPRRHPIVSPEPIQPLVAHSGTPAEGSVSPSSRLHRRGDNLGGPVDVIIPVKGSVNWVAECLLYLSRTDPTSLIGQIVIVDDGSAPEERQVLESLAALHPVVTVVENVSPKGFAAACNAGAAVSKAKYLLFLNSDCLVAPNSIAAMLRACEEDSSVGLVTALSNNAGTLSVDLPAGFSFLEVNDALEKRFGAAAVGDRVVEACTVVGHCLLVTRICFELLNGFDTSWGLGYGEETDLQMRAMQHGYRGVVPLDTFVYHFGGGTFKYEDTRSDLQRENHARFLQIWGAEYQKLASRSAATDPVATATHAAHGEAIKEANLDVLFVLPGMRHGVGGCMVVLDLCNHLIGQGVNAKVVILGDVDRGIMRDYPEALYAAPLFAKTQHILLEMASHVRPKVVVGTLFTTVFPARSFAAMTGAHFVNFVQGYEFYFDNGMHYGAVRESYKISEICLTTSEWLAEGVRRHSPDSQVVLLPLGVDPYTAFPRSHDQRVEPKVRIGIVLRHSPDKGQWILREVLDRLVAFESQLALSIFSSPQDIAGLHPVWSQSPDTRHVILPLDRYHMSSFLRRCDVIIDASLHEGFGLIPLEAMGNGATVVASDSGGVKQFLKHGVNGLLIEAATDPAGYVEAIRTLVDDRKLLSDLQRGAMDTAGELSRFACFERYREFFLQVMHGELTSVDHPAGSGTAVSTPAAVEAASPLEVAA